MKLHNVAISVALFLTSCSSSGVDSQLQSADIYKRDMIVTVNGVTFDGVGVAAKASKYTFQVQARGQLDLFEMTTCHREWTKERAWNVRREISSGLFGWGKKKIDVTDEVTFDFYPTPMESDGDCVMELSGYERDGGRNSWALIDFSSNVYSLPAEVECNGLKYTSPGTTICQSRAGIRQRVSFSSPTKFDAENPCKLVAPKDQMAFEIELLRGKCTVVFMTLDGTKRVHKITLIGYDKNTVR